MTDTVVALPTPATALAVLLEAAGKQHINGVYRGVLTPVELDAPARETEALARGAAVHDLGWLRRVAVRGEDRFRWLSGMVTNTVNDLKPNAGAWSLVLNAQGRIQGDLTVWREGENLELEIAADQYDHLMAHLERFIIMDDVELVPLNGEGPGEASAEVPLGLTGPKADEVLERLSLPSLAQPMTSVRVEWNGVDLRIARTFGALAAHYELWAPSALASKLWKYLHTAGATSAGSRAIEAFRIAEGIPAYGIDMVERDLPQETSQMRALSFNKGCYLGQEIVERIRSRGNVHRHLRQLELTGPLPERGTELMLDGAPAGQITSAAELTLEAGNRIVALGMIRGEAELKNLPLSYADGAGTARLLANPVTTGAATS
jgi:folate-binding protein YgfZ